MTLRLSVVSEHGIHLGAQSTKAFGGHGGTIGRGTDNDWILPDPERYLSAKHARVDFRAGAYVLIDLSLNGTYVNGAEVPLGKHRDHILKDGDYVRVGGYDLYVSIDPPQFDAKREAAGVHDATAVPDDRAAGDS
jgi:type VI secretion system FHA domain protein